MNGRTEAHIGDTLISGTRCSGCDTTFEECTRRIYNGHSACCRHCRRTDTHATYEVTPSRIRDTDLSPTISVQHRCPRMRDHLAGWAEKPGSIGKPGETPGDLPVPCDDCYSIVVTSIRVPWQPSREFTITEKEGTP